MNSQGRTDLSLYSNLSFGNFSFEICINPFCLFRSVPMHNRELYFRVASHLLRKRFKLVDGLYTSKGLSSRIVNSVGIAGYDWL